MLADVGLIHMNGRVYDPMIARFGTPDPMTENPFSTQGWNRYSYVGNSPLNFTDPSGYCFMGCFWKPIFKAIAKAFKQIIGAIIRIAAVAICTALPGCQPFLPLVAGLSSAFAAGVAGGDLGDVLRAGFMAMASAIAFNAIGDFTGHTPGFGTSEHFQNMAGHAAVGCAMAVASRDKCGPGALSGAVSSFAGPLMKGLNGIQKLVAHTVVGGAASVAGGGKFENGAITGAFGYLFNACGGKWGCMKELAGAGLAAGTTVAIYETAGTAGLGSPLAPWLVGGGFVGGMTIGAILDLLDWTPSNLLNIEPPGDAYDPDGPKAPGKPGEVEGFSDPKGGEDWVRNPNGRGWGWLDGSGDVWVPTGQGGKAHGGPHWDVQTPGGDYINVYPGGHRR